MKKFTVGSYQLRDVEKWVPSGSTFEVINGAKVNITEADIFHPEHRFDTKEEADQFFRDHFLSKGYEEWNE